VRICRPEDDRARCWKLARVPRPRALGGGAGELAWQLSRPGEGCWGCQGRSRPGAGSWKPARSDSQRGLASTGQWRCWPGLGKAARWRRSPSPEVGRPSRESEWPRREVQMSAQPGGRCPGPAGGMGTLG
jgi:hypothetical protein